MILETCNFYYVFIFVIYLDVIEDLLFKNNYLR